MASSFLRSMWPSAGRRVSRFVGRAGWPLAGLAFAALVAVAAVLVYQAFANASDSDSETARSGPAAGETDDDRRQSPALHHPEVAGMRVLEAETIDPPQPAPEFSLTNYDGSTVDLADLAGRVVVVSFVYTNCSEACPLLTGHYMRLQQQMAESIDRGNLALVFITTDPARDTPENLRTYTDGWGGRWLFLTGDAGSMKRVWDDYGIYREVRERLQEITVYHSYKTYLIDGAGRLRHRYTGVWQLDDVTDDLESLLAERS